MEPEEELSPAVSLEARDDALRVRVVHQAAFGRPDEADLVDLLRRRGELAVSLVARLNGQIVGHVALSPMTLDPPCTTTLLGLGPLAVHPEFQRRGIGSMLVERALDRARSQGCAAVCVLGDPGFYRRFGFCTALLGNRYGATEAFQTLELEPGSLSGLQGTAVYAEAFDQVGC